jgi:hypothetical protein
MYFFGNLGGTRSASVTWPWVSIYALVITAASGEQAAEAAQKADKQ